MRINSKTAVAVFFGSAGIAHLTFARKFFEDIVPPWLPASPKVVNEAAGVAEIAGAALALTPGAEKHARRYLSALLLAVFPANINMCARPQDSKTASATPMPLLWARLPGQLVLLWWVNRAVRKPGDTNVV